MEYFFFNDGAVKIIRSITESHLGEFQSEPDPVGGDMVEIVEVDAADGNGAQGIKSGGGRGDRNFIVLGLIRQRHEAGETASFILQGAQLPQMIDPIVN